MLSQWFRISTIAGHESAVTDNLTLLKVNSAQRSKQKSVSNILILTWISHIGAMLPLLRHLGRRKQQQYQSTQVHSSNFVIFTLFYFMHTDLIQNLLVKNNGVVKVRMHTLHYDRTKYATTQKKSENQHKTTDILDIINL